MGKLRDLTGMRFTNLVVLSLVPREERTDKRSNAKWNCICDCGNKHVVSSEKLINGETKSCGCRKKKSQEYRVKDLTGKTFGLWLVLERDGSDSHGTAMWKCQCSCGKISTVNGGNLRFGRSISCGHMKDLTGQVFGKLTVVEFYGRNKKGEAKWRCICSCKNKNERIVLGSALLGGITKSCGCYKIERATKHGLYQTREYKSAIDKRHRERKKIFDSEWTTEMEIAIKNLFKKCVICGGNDRLAVDHVYPLELGFGLKPGNAVILCIHCNSSKRDRHPSKLPDTMPPMSEKILLESADRFLVYWNLLCSRYPDGLVETIV